jgi:bifunctional non-homologous end joining protein LigD
LLVHSANFTSATSDGRPGRYGFVLHLGAEGRESAEGVRSDAFIDGELVAVGKDGVSHFELLQNALRHEAKLLYCAFDLMFKMAYAGRHSKALRRLGRSRLRTDTAARLGT